jgi:hypothetical protein
MKSNLRALPYPILGRSDDFVDSDFQTTVDFDKKTVDEVDVVVMSYMFLMSNDAVAQLIDKKLATYALDISCPDTLYRRVFYCDANSGVIDFPPGELYGKVTVEPIVVLLKPALNFKADDLNEEYQGMTFNLNPGDTIAIDETISRYIEFDKLKFESLVRIQTATDIPTETYRFDLQSDFIVILMGKDFRRLWEVYRDERDKAPFLAMSVYKDCILAALVYISHNESDSDQYKWARALKFKLFNLGRKINEGADFDDLNSHAQQLVSKLSVQRLLRNV